MPDSTFLVSDATVAPNGDLFVNHWGVIYRADWNSGELEYIGEEGEREIWAALSFTDQGDLFTGFSQLYRIDREAHILRNIGRFDNGYVSTTTAGQSNTWLIGADSVHGRIYKVDVATADITAIPDTGLPIRAIVLESPSTARHLGSPSVHGLPRTASHQQLYAREQEHQQSLRRTPH